MEISSELKAKLMKAGSVEEVKALLGDQASEEEAVRISKEIEAHRPADGLEAVDDDELEAVSGGNRDYYAEGCADTTNGYDWCHFVDKCDLVVTYYINFSTCSDGEGHRWQKETVNGVLYYYCPRYGKRKDKDTWKSIWGDDYDENF